MELQQISLDITDYVAVVTMNNPPVNATTPRMQEELTWCFDSFSDRDDVRVAILTGHGKVFCGGTDLKAKAGPPPAPGAKWASRRAWRECTYSMMECKKPVIAALNGPALGAGIGMAASCDILIASTMAEMGLPEINVGLLGGAKRTMRLFGHSKVRRMMFTGYRVKAPELKELCVVECVVPPEELMNTAMGIAREIASKSPIAIKLAKIAVNTIEDMSVRDGYRFEQDMTDELSRYDDSKEAIRAFMEKRPPKFTGK
jgi:enoyl-CoA hydratase/carnithine racemase